MTDNVPAPAVPISKPSTRRTRVRLRRINCDFSKPYPPDGAEKLWWDRLIFAVFDVHVHCDIRDRRGNSLASYTSTIIDAIQAKEVKTVRRLDIGAWPDQGKTATCLSSEAKKLPDQ